ncbi:hypothetical protein JOF55_002912 [Haloactinomyces albus]|uniref:Uncharacterized protein n=1 Tax=Haloactinomyces albus TaxID=1352928 RepID=A0AAE3ZF52_9ACTN|nr:hypothetical protein [Haloactinomyces albus]
MYLLRMLLDRNVLQQLVDLGNRVMAELDAPETPSVP